MVLTRKWPTFCPALTFLLLIFFLAPAIGQSPEKVEKRISRNIEETWPGREIARVPVDILAHSPGYDNDPPGKLFRLTTGGEPLGSMLLASAKGRYEYFDYLVFYDPLGCILRVDILVYRSDHGYEIMNKGWLKQFVGKKGCDLVYGKDVDAISGATFSAGALTTDIQRWCKVLGSGMR